MKKRFFAFFAVASLLLAGCATSSIFTELGDNISSPNGMVIDVATNRLYLVNSNSNVLYNWTEGSVQIYDITNPLSPVLLYTLPTESFSGEAVLDTVRKLLYVTNRFSEQTNVTQDHIFVINIDETSPTFLSLSQVVTGANPYGLYCCYPPDRMWIAGENNDVEFLNLADLTLGSTSLLQPLSIGGTLSQAYADFISVKGNQAFLPGTNGGLMIMDLDSAPNPAANALDYFVDDFAAPGGIANDGTYIYLVDVEQDDGTQYYLYVLDMSSLPPIPDNTYTVVVDKDDQGIVLAQIDVCKDPLNVAVSSQYAFVTCKNGDDAGLVSVIDLATRTVVNTLTVGKTPFQMELYQTGGVDKYLYIGDVEYNTLTIVDIPTLTIVATYP